MSNGITSNPGLVKPSQFTVAKEDSKALPTFSPVGWVTDPLDKMDYLWCHFFAADAGMSYLNPTTTYNIQNIFGQASNNPDKFISDLKDILEIYFKSFFQEASVEVRELNTEKGDSINVTVGVFISVMENGKTYGIDQLVNYRNNKFQTVLNRNNYGRE